MSKLKFIHNLSISNKIVVIILSVTCLILVAGFTLVAIWNIDKLKSNTQSALLLNAKLVGSNCIVPLTFGDKQQATEVLLSLKNIEFVELAYLYDKSENLFASYPDSLNGITNLELKKQQGNIFLDGYFYIHEPIVFQNEVYGTLFIKANSIPLIEARQNIIFTFSLVALLLIVLSFFLAKRMQKYISAPIVDLNNHFDKITESHDYSVRISKLYNDEIGNLFDGFNSMLNQIKIKQDYRDKAEESLRDSEAKFHGMIMNLLEGFYSVTLDGKLMNYNPAFVKLLGLEPEKDYSGLQLPDFWQNPEDRKAYIEEFLKYGVISNYIVNAKKSNGEKIVVQVNSSLIKDEKGKPVRIDSVFIDITERKLAEEALKESNERFNIAFNQQFVLMAILSPEGYTIEINDLPLKLQGVQREDYIGKLFWQSPTWENSKEWQEKIKNNVKQVVSMEEPLFTEDVFFSKDGNSRNALAIYNTVRDAENNPHYILVQAMDITERKLAEEEVRMQLDELQRWHEVILGREGRVQELKQEVNVLLKQSGKSIKYESCMPDDKDVE